jgi:hypothetical protein
MYALEVNHRSAPLVRHLCRKITAASPDPAKVKKVCDRTAETDLWIERFHVATWLEYVRDRQRRTRADLDNAERIRALHIHGHAPRVRRMIERPVGSSSSEHAPGEREADDPMTDPTRAN